MGGDWGSGGRWEREEMGGERVPSRKGMPQIGHSSEGLRDFLGTRSSSGFWRGVVVI